VIEEGRDVAYVEHWHRGVYVWEPCGALHLSSVDGSRTGFLVRSGVHFMYARSRPGGAPTLGTTLAQAIALAPALAAARELMDCEISLSDVTGDGWVIRRSSLPYRDGANLATAVQSAAGDWPASV
jgi:hypothetical protein